MARHSTVAPADAGRPADRPEPSGGWPHLAYRVTRRAVGLQLVQPWTCDLRCIAEPPWDDAYEFRPLDADDVRRLAVDPAVDLAHTTALRLAAGGRRCFAAMDGPNLACYVWFAENGVGPEDTMGIPVSLPSDACYLFNAFTAPAYRRRGIYVRTATRALWELCRLGKARAIALIEYGNVASMRSHGRIGMKPQGWIVSLGRGGLACRWCAPAARQCGCGDLRLETNAALRRRLLKKSAT